MGSMINSFFFNSVPSVSLLHRGTYVGFQELCGPGGQGKVRKKALDRGRSTSWTEIR